jgi:hypothetical protein
LKFGDRLVAAGDVHAAFLAALDGSYGQVVKTEDILNGKWE